MKVKLFNTLNASSAAPGQPTLHINTKAGLFSLNKPLVDLLKIEADSQLSLTQDKDCPRDWYITTNDSDGFPIRMTNKDKYISYSFNSTHIAKAIFLALDIDTASIKIRVSDVPVVEDGITLYPLITAAVIKK